MMQAIFLILSTIFGLSSIAMSKANIEPQCEIEMKHNVSNQLIEEMTMTQFTLTYLCDFDNKSVEANAEDVGLCKKKLDSLLQIKYSSDSNEMLEPELIKELENDPKLKELHDVLAERLKDGKAGLLEVLFSEVRIPIRKTNDESLEVKAGGENTPLKFESLAKHFRLAKKNSAGGKDMESFAKKYKVPLVTREIDSVTYYEQDITPRFSLGSDANTFEKAKDLGNPGDEVLVGNYFLWSDLRANVSVQNSDNETTGARILALRNKKTGEVKPLIQFIKKSKTGSAVVLKQQFISTDGKSSHFVNSGNSWTISESVADDSTNKTRFSVRCTAKQKSGKIKQTRLPVVK